MTMITRAPKPAHVPNELVFDFDMYNVPGSDADAHAAFFAIQQTHPDIFWTPLNGGHWVVTRADDVETVLRDPELFSSTRVALPRDDTAPRLVPIEIDPPRHTQLRRPLTFGMVPRVVDKLEDGIRELTISLIEEMRPDGGCEFVKAFAQVLPLCIFLDLVDLPRNERHYLHDLVERFVKGKEPKIRAEAQMEVFQYIQETVRARRANPADDLASKIVNCEVDGTVIDEQEATAFITLVLFAGLDTVASMLSYIMLFLAQNPGHRQQLIDRLDDEEFLKSAMEELFRRHGIIVTARVVSRNTLFRGIEFHADDTVLPIHLLCGLDDRRVENPLKVDFNRTAPARHSIFGLGPHTCPGAMLARREIKIFLQEWLRQIPEFSVRPDSEVRNVLGLTCCLDSLHIIWDVPIWTAVERS